MAPKKYYVRVAQSIHCSLERYFEEQGIPYSHLSNDFGANGGTSLYSAKMDSETALTLNLKFPIIGCLNFKKTLDNLNNTIHRCDDEPSVLK